jgi:hypothetical protein
MIANGPFVTQCGKMSVASPIPSAPAQHVASNAMLDPWVVVAFIWPLGRIFEIQLIGTLYAQDVMSVLLLLIVLARQGAGAQLREVRWVFYLGALWLLGQIFTDLYRNSAFEDYSRGWAKIAMFLITFAAMWLFLPIRRAYLVAYAAGMAIAAYAAVPDADVMYGAEGVRWRFGLGDALMISTSVVFAGFLPGTQRLTRFSPLALAIGAAFLLAVGARSNFGFAIAAAALCQVFVVLRRSPRLAASIRPSTFAVFLLLGLWASQGPVLIYSSLADNGALGAEAQAKYRNQEIRGSGNIILGGRTEIYVSLTAIKDSPILGHGSWAQDFYYNRLLRHRLIEAGEKWQNLQAGLGDVIPAHSYLFGSWVDGGVAGGIFWIYVMIMAVVSIYHSLLLRDDVRIVYAYMVFSLLWGVLFSPFGSALRFPVAFQVTMIFFIIGEAKRRRRHVRSGQPTPSGRA